MREGAKAAAFLELVCLVISSLLSGCWVPATPISHEPKLYRGVDLELGGKSCKLLIHIRNLGPYKA